MHFFPLFPLSPHGVSCRGHRRCRPALPLRFVATVWWWWCDSWCRTGPPSSRQTENIYFPRVNTWMYPSMYCLTVWYRILKCCSFTHQPSLRFDERSVDAVHLMVQSTCIAQVVAGTIPPPEGGRHRPAVHTLSSLSKVIKQVWWRMTGEKYDKPKHLFFSFPVNLIWL